LALPVAFAAGSLLPNLNTLNDSQKISYTLLVIAITLVVICYQVFLAREELKQVRRDVENNAVLIKEATNASKLWLYGHVVQFANGGTAAVRTTILNTGEKVDILYTVTLGPHKSFKYLAEGWRQISWRPTNSLHAYRDFLFYTHVGTTPVFKGSYLELPVFTFAGAFDTGTYPLVLWAISTIYERNPEKQDWYYGMEVSRVDAPRSRLIFSLKYKAESEPAHITAATYDGKTTTLQQLLQQGFQS